MLVLRKWPSSFLNKRQGRVITLALFLFAAALLAAPDAQAIRVSLKRVVFDNTKKSEVLTIINSTAQEQTYRLGWRKYRMREEKSLQAVEDGSPEAEGIPWADDMIRFAPRRVTVPAGGSQQIRLLFRRPADLKDGEYRSHLWVITEAKPEKFSVEPPKGKQSVRLAVQPAISLPIFVRVGKLTAKASITDAKLTARGSDKLNIALTLNREGTRSIYGDFDFICTSGSKEVVLQQVRGISVYTEVNKRKLDFDLALDAPEKKGCTAIRIQYRADPDDPDFKGQTLAEGSAKL